MSGGASGAAPGKTVLEARGLVQEFRQGRYAGRKVVHALNGVDLEVLRGETLGLVGETGCGKSTLARVLLRLYRPSAGRVFFEGTDITRMRERDLGFVRRRMSMVFQDPVDSMNGRLTVGAVLEEPLVIQTRLGAKARRDRCLALLADVGLPEDSLPRYPHEFSGGQRQRIAIARALANDPEVLLCDEPVSALDVSVQSQILNLLLDLQKKRGLTMVFVSHALSVVRHMSDRVAVMYLGSLMELADSRIIYEAPRHPYTRALIAAIPSTDPARRGERILSTGEVPSPIDLPAGCPFQGACSVRIDVCAVVKPPLRPIGAGHLCACHLAGA